MEKIALFGLCAAIMCVVLKKYNKDYALFLSLFAVCAILLAGIEYALPIINIINEYAQLSVIPSYQISIIFKAIACAYLAQFASDICKDAGENSIALKIENSARLIIAYMSLPAVVSLFEYLLDML
ncbi:MAG: hypothetical protein E7218_07190 [Anaerofustis stercorihominis]|nr:hypothetical protein [Anaerofustis stercorihominis]